MNRSIVGGGLGREKGYWLAQVIRYSQVISRLGSIIEGISGFRERSSIFDEASRPSCLMVISPVAVFTATRSPLRGFSEGERIIMLPSR